MSARTVVLALVLVGVTTAVCVAQPEPGGRRGPPPHPLVTALDTDRDGEVSAGEIGNAAASLKALDSNGDGKLSGDEVAPRFGPFGGRGMREGGPPLGGRPDASAFQSAPIQGTEAEKKILAVLADMRQRQPRGMMNVPEEDGRLLRLLTEAAGAQHVVEVGTSNGYSAIWLCLALRTTGGRLTTYEIDKHRAGLARENFKRAGVAGLVTLVEGDQGHHHKRRPGDAVSAYGPRGRRRHAQEAPSPGRPGVRVGRPCAGGSHAADPGATQWAPLP